MSYRHLARNGFRVAVLLGSLTAGVPVSRAAIQKPGVLAGHVVDKVGQALPGVVVTIAPERGGVSRHVTSEGDGSYRLEELPDDTYWVSFDLRAFDLVRWTNVNVRADIPATVDAVLSVSSACECVTSR